MSDATVTARPRTVREETDAEILTWAIPFFSRSADRPELFPFEPRIVDVTWGRGRFWRGSPWRRNVVGLDLDPHDGARIAADFGALPLRAASVDVLVFDPPHISEAGPASSVCVKMGFREHGISDVCELFPPFFAEARRVLVDGGIVLAKIADQVHRGRMRWHHGELILSAERAGLVACNGLVKVRRACIMDPRWKAQLHARQNHCFWIVCRKGGC